MEEKYNTKWEITLVAIFIFTFGLIITFIFGEMNIIKHDEYNVNRL